MPTVLRRLAFILLLASPLWGQGGERIRSFDSRITVNSDGTLSVRESITVTAMGRKIRHGIYRDFPTKYKDTLGNLYDVGFSIISLERDGRRELYHKQALSNGVRTYFGSPKEMLSPGEYTYVFEYSVTRELGFFSDHDELYWNVTGNGWDFPINIVTASILLPPHIASAVQQTTAFTGFTGERKQEYAAEKDDLGNPTFRAENLGVHQGLTVLVTWPKGLIAPPTPQQKLSWFFQDNQGLLVGLIGVICVWGYFSLAWLRVGRDPRPGTIMPLYEPPANLSPAAIRYLKLMQFDNKAFTAAILGLAAKGLLKIRHDESQQYELIKNDSAPTTQLLPEESLLARELFEDRTHLYLAPENQGIITRAKKALSLSLQGSMQNVYFVTNSRYMWPGVVLSTIFVGLLLLTQAPLQVTGALFMTFWLTFWTVGVAALLVKVSQAWSTAIRIKSPLGEGSAIFLTLFSIPFLAGECFGAYALYKFSGIPVFVPAMLMLGGVVLFHFLLRAPTTAGRQLLDRIDGFKMFLGATEGDRYFASISKTPELFERFLPYAFALDMGRRWAEHFSQVLGAAANTGSSPHVSYCPGWYVANDLAVFSAASFTQSFSDSFSSAVSVAASPPGSSSGSGGGGSSGGGGGGGGGGGW
jgi:uncharacterized membrane protein YgcG